MVCALDGHALLALWEGALAQPDALRGDAVLRQACDEETPLSRSASATCAWARCTRSCSGRHRPAQSLP
jgi:hypothetical protein